MSSSEHAALLGLVLLREMAGDRDDTEQLDRSAPARSAVNGSESQLKDSNMTKVALPSQSPTELAPFRHEVIDTDREITLTLDKTNLLICEKDELLTPAEVATIFHVDPKTVTRWVKSGKLTSIRTLGGHRRYRETEVRALLADS